VLIWALLLFATRKAAMTAALSAPCTTFFIWSPSVGFLSPKVDVQAEDGLR